MNQEMLKKMKENADENASQIVVGIKPTAKYCQSCIYSNGQTPDSNKPHKAHCMMYPKPISKPKGVLFDDAECPSYKKE